MFEYMISYNCVLTNDYKQKANLKKKSMEMVMIVNLEMNQILALDNSKGVDMPLKKPKSNLNTVTIYSRGP